ncbi:hypothetical protein ACFCZT_09290 [Streptomyces sp. NPDC056230]|uniref:hypothetical protein n=1 Tax=Streptomyces sp. NPDC056230 TaxID=3345754 RepID=UPI0035D98F43
MLILETVRRRALAEFLLEDAPNETHTGSLKWPAGAGEIKGAYIDVEVYPTHTTE